ncbi:MAG: hypothetical protein JXB15_04610 [Anaerolineales bacterium]|nr:hypothetical protein [Anaerolineales bacterium]
MKVLRQFFWRLTSAVLLLALCLPGSGLNPAEASGLADPDCPGGQCRPDGKPLNDFIAEPVAPSPTGGPDVYGYTWEQVTPSWKDATSGTTLFASGADDETLGPYNIGFTFPYYELSPTQFWVGSNGLLGFNDSIEEFTHGVTNLPIIFDVAPTAFLAPFWDDLSVGGGYNSGRVYYKTGWDGLGQYLVIEWHQVTRLGSLDTLTFEVVLYQNGTILFQYQTLNGVLDSATIGIEDGDDSDGLLYLYNEAGLTTTYALRFNRPGDTPRAKAFPLAHSGFTVHGEKNFTINLRNTGESGADVYNLAPTFSDTDWEIDFYANGVLLKDTDADDRIETPSLPQGSTLPVLAVVRAPASPSGGDEVEIDLEVSSTLNGSQSTLVQLTVAVPVPFALNYFGGLLDVNVELYAPDAQVDAALDAGFTGNSFVFNNISDGRFLCMWEKNELGSPPPDYVPIHTNLQYNLLDTVGGVVFATNRLLTDNSVWSEETKDFEPVLASSEDGRVGVAWLRQIRRASDGRNNYNVFFQVLESDGDPLFADPINLTNNALYTSGSDADNLAFLDPTITATGGSNFLIGWIERHTLPTKTTTDLGYAVYASSGTLVKAKDYLMAFNQGDNLNYSEIDLTSLDGVKVMATFWTDNEVTQDEIAYLLLNNDGTKQFTTPSHLFYGRAESIDVVQLSNGRVALAWTNLDTGNGVINVAVLAADLTPPGSPVELLSPGGREGEAASISRDENGHAIIIWMDNRWNQHLYYALINPAGIVTHAMIFKSSGGATSSIKISAGVGLASSAAITQIFLPKIRKRS